MHTIQMAFRHYTVVLFDALVSFLIMVGFEYTYICCHQSSSHLTLYKRRFLTHW